MNSYSTQLCRLCLETTADSLNIFEKFQDADIASILVQHFWFQMYEGDGMSEWVCKTCWIQSKTFHDFYKRLESRHRNYLKSMETKDDEMFQDQIVSPTEEALDADLNSVKGDNETDILENVSPTEEALDTDLNSVKCDDVTVENDGMCTIIESVSFDEDNNDNSSDHQGETDQSSDSEDQFFNGNTKNDDIMDDGPQSRREKREKENELIRKYFRMKCEICDDVELDTLAKAKKHYRQVHKTEGYLICCGRKFKFRMRMMDHVRYHVNPFAYRCEQCGKFLKNRSILKLHEKSHQAPLRQHKCNLCSKILRTAVSLKKHVKTMHSTDPPKKFPCDQCNKICRSKCLLASHIKNSHGPSLDLVCEICGQTFKHFCSLQNHLKIQHSAKPAKAQCDICGVWVKHERYLPRHLRLHQEMQDAQDGNAETVNCPICDKKVQNKRILSTHMRATHVDRKYRCTYCDKAFKTPKSLKEHIALHTGIDLYSCQYCGRTFKSNANLYAHRKKAHAAEWTRDRTKRTDQNGSSEK